MSAIRYLLDENVDVLYHGQLLAHEPTLVVWRVELLLIWGASEEKEYHDQLSFLPVSS